MPEHKQILIRYSEWDRDELTGEEEADLAWATEAREDAHAPYSGFKVGAAIRTKDEDIFTGHNVENIIYNALHAEQGAIGEITKRSREAGIKRITVVGGMEEGGSDQPTTPCGICRQSLLELVKEEDNPDVIMAGTRGKILKMKLLDMLPLAFYPESIKK